MQSIRIAAAAFAVAALTIALADHASAAVILSQDFKSGLSDKEKIVSYGAVSSFGVHDGVLGHSSQYANYEDSLYIADLDLTEYRNVMISYDLVTEVEVRYDVFRTEIGATNAAGRFESAYNVDAVSSDVSLNRSFAVPDNRLASQFAFRFVSDHSIPDVGVQVRNLLITGDRIPGTGTGTDVPPVGTVPEPATWSMMISGFGAMGGMLRRRRKSGSDCAALA